MGHECIVTDLTGEDVESRRFHLKYLDFCLLFKKSWNSSSPGPHSHSHTWGASPFRQAWTCGLSQLPPSLLSLVCLAPLLGVGSPTRWSWWNIRPPPPPRVREWWKVVSGAEWVGLMSQELKSDVKKPLPAARIVKACDGRWKENYCGLYS